MNVNECLDNHNILLKTNTNKIKRMKEKKTSHMHIVRSKHRTYVSKSTHLKKVLFDYTKLNYMVTYLSF